MDGQTGLLYQAAKTERARTTHHTMRLLGFTSFHNFLEDNFNPLTHHARHMAACEASNRRLFTRLQPRRHKVHALAR